MHADASIDRSGLLLRAAGAWHFADSELLAAAGCSLDQSLENGAELFGPEDRWRERPGLAPLAAFLAERGECACQRRRTPAMPHSSPVCAFVEVRDDPRRLGERALHTARPAAAGELLLQEEAVAAVLWDPSSSTRCHHCLRLLPSLAHHVACDCRDAVYCGERCAAAARSGAHGFLCGTRLEALAPRTLILCLRVLLSPDGSACDAVLRLHECGSAMPPARTSRLRFLAHLGAAVASAALEPRGRTCAQLEKVLRIALTNVFAIPAADAASADEPRGPQPRCEAAAVQVGVGRANVGEALFATASRINHTCDTPNCIVRLDGSRIQVRAAGPMRAGDEVLSCYGPQAGYDSLSSRRATLQASHFFTCGCAACTREEAQEARAAAGAQPDAARSAQQTRLRAQRLDECALRAAEAEDWTEAARLSRQALELLGQVFPRGSTQLAHEEAKLARLLFNADADARAAAALRRAAESLATCYGPECEEAHELRRLSEMCMRR
jgi:hypothetical protein